MGNPGFRNFGSPLQRPGWQFGGGDSRYDTWIHPGPLHLPEGTFPYGGTAIIRKPPISCPPPKPPQQAANRLVWLEAQRRAREQAERLAEQARERERAAREASERQERAERERQLREQQHAIQARLKQEQQNQNRRLQEHQRLILDQQREQQQNLSRQLDLQRQQHERLARQQHLARRVSIKDRPIEASWISPLDFVGGFAPRGVRTAGSVGLSLLGKLGKIVSGMAARRSSSVLKVAARQLVEQSHQATGRVVLNLLGTGEVPGAINVNSLVSQQVKGIPNLLRAAAERVGELFPAGSVDAIVSNNAGHGMVNWATAARGCFDILRSGGRISIAPYVGGDLVKHLGEITSALRAAGFHQVAVQVGKFVTAIKP
jgi:hypothetical protein